MIRVVCKDNRIHSVNGAADLLQAVRAAGEPFEAPCGGAGRCGKCMVELVSGLFVPIGFTGAPSDVRDAVNLPGITADARIGPKIKDGKMYARACVTSALGDAVIKIPDRSDAAFFGERTGETLAVDLGTTIIEAAVVDGAGQVRGGIALPNPLAAYGADVLSRIAAAKQGNFDEMHRLTADCVAKLAADCGCKGVMAVGNTAALHFLLGADPSSMGEYPFRPAFTRSGSMTRGGIKIRTLGCLSAFIGADALAGAAFLSLREGEMMVDLGTNCEIAMYSRGKYYMCSAAAGPAIEGAGISCGMGGRQGAIDSVFYDKGMKFTVIGGAEPEGICGSGLIDAVAVAVRIGLVDESGAMDKNLDGRLSIGGVSVGQKDVRAFQLAKSAVRAAIETVCGAAGTAPSKILLAGGLGLHVNPASAKAVGMIPDVRTSACGNAALKGCVRAAADPRFKQSVNRIKRLSRVEELKGRDFEQKLIAYTALRHI